MKQFERQRQCKNDSDGILHRQRTEERWRRPRAARPREGRAGRGPAWSCRSRCRRQRRPRRRPPARPAGRPGSPRPAAPRAWPARRRPRARRARRAVAPAHARPPARPPVSAGTGHTKCVYLSRLSDARREGRRSCARAPSCAASHKRRRKPHQVWPLFHGRAEGGTARRWRSARPRFNGQGACRMRPCAPGSNTRAPRACSCSWVRLARAAGCAPASAVASAAAGALLPPPAPAAPSALPAPAAAASRPEPASPPGWPSRDRAKARRAASSAAARSAAPPPPPSAAQRSQSSANGGGSCRHSSGSAAPATCVQRARLGVCGSDDRLATCTASPARAPGARARPDQV